MLSLLDDPDTIVDIVEIEAEERERDGESHGRVLRLTQWCTTVGATRREFWCSATGEASTYLNLPDSSEIDKHAGRGHRNNLREVHETVSVWCDDLVDRFPRHSKRRKQKPSVATTADAPMQQQRPPRRPKPFLVGKGWETERSRE
ncbi:hypothetical protein RUM44_001142 [Polyplax serrata]|uniref:Uncharacterized protein n=1 Tax=Polyplax serrata TaxID=468196 RepID=A0ABR1B6Q6_POLSC